MSIKRSTISLIVLVMFLTCVVSEETEALIKNNATELIDTGRKRNGFGLHRWWGIYGIHALGVLYWLKVKAVIVAFVVGTAIVWGFRWYKGHGCSDIIHESPLISYDHGPAWTSGPHDHIPYSLDYNPYEHEHIHDHEHFSASETVSDSFPENGPYSSYSDAQPTAPAADETDHIRRKRQLESEEQVSDIVFAFLGITNDGCRRRFICEMEFRSKVNPITRIAFGIVGRGLFSKYVNRNNAYGRAASFKQCSDVNPDCVFVEENINDDEENEVSNQEEEEPYEGRDLKTPYRDMKHENATNSAIEIESTKQILKDPIVRGIFSRVQLTN